MALNLQRLKPGVSVRTHRIVAAALWSTVGLVLMVRGGLFISASDKLWVWAIALVIGTLKSLFVLDRSARKNIHRLAEKKDGACLGGVYSLKMWGLILCMIVFGRILRVSGLPFEYVGLIFSAIGWALFFSSRLLWQNVFRRAHSIP